jgi:Ca2+-binding EF-hand superfamily protein
MNKIGGCLDIDSFLNLVIESYLEIISKTTEYVKYAFSSADLDGSNKVTIQEFLILFKHLEPEHLNESDLFVLFHKISDTEEDGKAAVSLQKFSEICFTRGLFLLET